MKKLVCLQVVLPLIFFLPDLHGYTYHGSRLPEPEIDSLIPIEEIVVTTRRFDNSVIPAQILAGGELERLSVHSVADAIRYFSGVQIKDYGGIGGLKTVNIRSMGSNHVGVFYDGIQIGNAQNGVVDLGRFSLDNMEAVSMYNGQKSNIFQTAKDYASAGAVYLQTRTPVFGEGRKSNFRTSVKGGSFATINPSLLWEHRINDNLTGSANAEFLYTSGKYKFSYSKKNGYDTTEVRQNGDVRVFRAEAGLFGKINGGEWRTKLYFYNSERGYPGASVREEPGRFKHQDRQWDDNFFVQSSFRKKLSRTYSMMFNVKYAYDLLHYLSDPRLDESTMYVNNKYRQQEVYLSSANEFTIFDWWTASLSADFLWNQLNADLEAFAYPRRYTVLSAAATSFNTDHLSFQASMLYTHVTDKTRHRYASARYKDHFTPSVIASYQPFSREQFYIRAFYKRIFRMPTLNDNYYTFIGNINLNPEFTTQYNLGVAYMKELRHGILRHLNVQLDVYYNKVDDKIVAMPTSNQFRWTMLNLGNVEIKGLDVAARGGFRIGRSDLSLRLSYTYQKAQDFTDRTSDFYGGQIPYIPWHSGSVVLGWERKGWNLNYSFIYTGERYESVANIPENYARPWYTHDMSLSRQFDLKCSSLRITGEVNNIFNQQYEVVRCYPMPGTNFRIIVVFTM